MFWHRYHMLVVTTVILELNIFSVIESDEQLTVRAESRVFNQDMYF